MQVEEIHVWLKQALRAWYARIDNYLHKLSFFNRDVDSNLYFKVVENQPMVLVLYVDDVFSLDRKD